MQKIQPRLQYQENSFYFIQPQNITFLTQVCNYIIIRNKQTGEAHICKFLQSNYQKYISIGNSIEVPYEFIDKIKSQLKYENDIVEIYEILVQHNNIENLVIYQQTRAKRTTTDNIKPLLSSVPIISSAIIRFKFQTFQIGLLNDGIYKISDSTLVNVQTHQIQQLKASNRDYLEEFITNTHNCYLSHLEPLQKLSLYMKNPHGGATVYGDDAREQLFQFVYKNKKCHEYQLANDEAQEKYIDKLSTIMNFNYKQQTRQQNSIQINNDVLTNQKFLDFYIEQNYTDSQFQLLYNGIINCMIFKQTFVERSEAQAEQARLTSKIILHLDSNEHKFYQQKIKYSLIQLIDDPTGQEQALRRQGRFGIDIQIQRIQTNIRKRLVASLVLKILLQPFHNLKKINYKILDMDEYIQFVKLAIDQAIVQKLFCDEIQDKYVLMLTTNRKQQNNYFEQIIQRLNQYEYDDIVIILQKVEIQIQKELKNSQISTNIQNIGTIEQLDDIINFIHTLNQEHIQVILQILHSAVQIVTMKYPKKQVQLQLTQLEPIQTVLFEDIIQQLEKSENIENDNSIAQVKFSNEVYLAIIDKLKKRKILFNCKQQLEQIVMNFQMAQLPKTFDELNLQPQHVILYGTDPGCGKSAICKHIASIFPQYKVFIIQTTNIFSQYVGESERNVSKIFAKARQIRPCILVFENLDVVIGKRRGGIGLSAPDHSDEDLSGVSQKVLTTFLTELDGVSHNNDQLYCIGICGCDISILDSAIVRYKRFGLHIKFSNMKYTEIASILQTLNVTNVNLNKDVEMSSYAFSQYLMQLLCDRQ